jgi:ABC-type multidrug transport system fused ATPase/permease subunit
MQAVGASERVLELVNRKPSITTSGGKTIGNLQGKVELANVTFSYPSRHDVLVLDNVSIHLDPGTITALVGPSGSGKSTIVALIERYYDVDQGSVSIDGCDVRQLDMKWSRRNVGYVSQEPVLFAMTIRENITYGLDRLVSEHEVTHAAQEANAHEFIQSFPDAYETLVC